jgi:dienelactone hydrolase
VVEAPLSVTPAAHLLYPFRPVEFASPAESPWPVNNRVPGLFAAPPGRPEPGPAVVLLHGYRGRKEEMAGYAQGLLLAGYAVLLPDLPLHGERALGPDGAFEYPSYGDPSGVVRALQQASADLRAAAAFLQGSGWVDPARLGVGGVSLGGCLAILALATAGGCYRAGVSVVGTARWARLIATSSITPDIRDDLASLGLGPPELEALYRPVEPTERADTIHRLLMIAGDQDPIVPFECVLDTWARLEHRTNRLEVVAGGGHHLPADRVYPAVVEHLGRWL